MNALGRTAKNIAMLMSGQVVTWASTLILAAAYGRFLGASGYGELFLATTFISLIGFPIEFCFNQQIVRDVAREPESAHRYITMGLALKAALWAGLFLIALLLSVALGYSREQTWLIAMFGVILFTTAISTTLISAQTAYLQVGMAKFGAVIEKVLDAVVAVLLLRAGAGVISVGFVLIGGSIAGMMWQIWRTARVVGLRLEWSPTVAKELIRSGMSFLAYGAIGVIYYRIDTILLSVFATDAAIGVYGAAYRLFDTLAFIPGIVVGAVMSPILAIYSKDTDKRKLRLAVEKTTTAMLLCGVPAAAGMIVTAPNIIGFVYQRQDFSGSEAVLQALSFGLIALFLNSVITTVLVSTGQERKLPLMALGALVFNVGLNLFLIPRFMDMGAAWATTLTELLLLIFGLVLIDRSLIPIQLLTTMGKIILASLIMAVVAHELDTLTIVTIIPIAAAVYVVAVLALRVLPADDLLRLTSPIKRYVGPYLRFAPGWAIHAMSLLTGVGVAPAATGPVASALSVEREPVLAQLAQAAPVDAVIGLTDDRSPELIRLNARGEHSATGSVPLNIPVRIPVALIQPHRQASVEGATLLPRRMQRRLAQLDPEQVVAALAHHHLGRIALSVRRVSLNDLLVPAAGQQHPSIGTAIVSAAGAGEQERIAGECHPDAFNLLVQRERTPKRAKEHHGRRSRPLAAERTRRTAPPRARRATISRPRGAHTDGLDDLVVAARHLADAEDSRGSVSRQPELAGARRADG